MAGVSQRSNPLVDITSMLGNLAPIFLGSGKTTQTVGGGSSTQSSSGGTTTRTNNNLDPAIAAQLAELISQPAFSKASAMEDSKSAVSAAMQDLMQGAMPTIANAERGSGVYNSTTTKLLADDLAAKTAAAGAKLQLDTVKDYADVNNAATAIAAQTLKGANTTEKVTETPQVITRTEGPRESTSKTGPVVDPLKAAMVAGGGALATSLLGNIMKGVFETSDAGSLADPDMAFRSKREDSFSGGGDVIGDITSFLTPDFLSGKDIATENLSDSFNVPMLSSLSEQFNNFGGTVSSDASNDFFGSSYGTASTDASVFDTVGDSISSFFNGSTDDDTIGASFDLGSIGSAISDFFSGSDCFITTAVCDSMGKPDDCEELTKLRAFRDDYMKASDEGSELVAQYYREAPAMVAALATLPKEDRDHIYRNLHLSYIMPALDAINSGRHDDAQAIYTDLFNFVARLAANITEG